ncbi:hypothetical protein BofuT4_P150510.1 [Botrytis cinerea T4]|uniref:Uncharacterized protein n=1 Tax=Botryotinia fuckeliana (strain T4) TaxID=999810 RepID=G2YWC1_BOTF4|nr:hypothetical protein BofuT4_P150510.1 [Botrytis cinerea T4]
MALTLNSIWRSLKKPFSALHFELSYPESARTGNGPADFFTPPTRTESQTREWERRMIRR